MFLIARLGMILIHVDPQARRKIELPVKIRLDHRHGVIRVAMGWPSPTVPRRCAAWRHQIRRLPRAPSPRPAATRRFLARSQENAGPGQRTPPEARITPNP